MMAILVDNVPVICAGRIWYHMTSDKDLEELIAFARKLGLKKQWLQEEGALPHYIIVHNLRDRVVAMGARVTTVREVATAACMIARKRREDGERSVREGTCGCGV